MAFLLEPEYRRFLAETHPELMLSDDRLSVPSFVAPLDIREPLKPGATRRLVTSMTQVAPQWVVPRSLFLGTPFERYDQTHILNEVDDPETLAQDALRTAESMGLHMVVLCNVSPDHERFAQWLNAGFVHLPSFPDTVVPLGVASSKAAPFDAHLVRLRAEDRSGIRRNIRRFERAGHRLERVRDSEALGGALYAAYRPLFEKATVRWQPHSEAYFRQLGSFDDRVELTAAWTSDDRLAGFVVSFLDGNSVQAGRIGVSPGFVRKDAVYFRLMYHLLESALAQDLGPDAYLSLEPTGYRMKRHLGATRRRMVNLVLGSSWSWRALLGGLTPVGRWLLGHLEESRILEQAY